MNAPLEKKCCTKCFVADHDILIGRYMEAVSSSGDYCGNKECECHDTTPIDNIVREAEETLDKMWSRGHIPDWAKDVKIVIARLIPSILRKAHALGEASGREQAIKDIKHGVKLQDNEGEKRSYIWSFDFFDALGKAGIPTGNRTTPHEEGKA